MTAEQPWLQSN